MKWPLVRRSTHERALTERHETIGRWFARWQAERELATERALVIEEKELQLAELRAVLAGRRVHVQP